MLLKGLNYREAARVGTALADGFFLQAESAASRSSGKKRQSAPAGRELKQYLRSFLKRVGDEARRLQPNMFLRAVIANSFKWRLLEKGVERQIVGELTHALVVRLSSKEEDSTAEDIPAAAPPVRRSRRSAELLFAEADQLVGQGAWAEAVSRYQEALELEPKHAAAHNSIGAALCRLGQYREAEQHFRRAIALKSGYAEAHRNLGTVLRWRGQIAESEMPLRQALKLSPTDVHAQLSLGSTLLLLGRLPDAKELFEKILRLVPRHVDAMTTQGYIAALEGRGTEAEATLKRALEIEPRSPSAVSTLIRLRRMTPADQAVLAAAEASVSGGLAPHDEASVRYAIGKYHDDIGEYAKAFPSFQRANQLQRAAADLYDPEARRLLVDDLIRTYTPELFSQPQPGSSDSMRPVLVMGMPRSGTSLVEQIIASHPAAEGAGELTFWSKAVRGREEALLRQPIGETLRRKLAGAYVRELAPHRQEALRVVDKTPFNSDYLGIIHSVFPRARMIYLRRDPIDSCLSCYFTHFPTWLNFTTDLEDLAHYYGEHRRLMAHWRKALPPGTILDVPYQGLIDDPEAWSRRIIEFIGLEWDPRCLDFHKTERTVQSASYSQVREPVYRRSVGRWRNYKKFIGPLLGLTDPDR